MTTDVVVFAALVVVGVQVFIAIALWRMTSEVRLLKKLLVAWANYWGADPVDVRAALSDIVKHHR